MKDTEKMSNSKNDLRRFASIKLKVCMNTETENAIKSSLVPTQGFPIPCFLFQQPTVSPELKGGELHSSFIPSATFGMHNSVLISRYCQYLKMCWSVWHFDFLLSICFHLVQGLWTLTLLIQGLWIKKSIISLNFKGFWIKRAISKNS